MKILSPEQIYKADQITIQQRGITSEQLMEEAGTAVFRELTNKLSANSEVHIFCGGGNNGGDGLVIARKLALEGFNVKVYEVTTTSNNTDDYLKNLKKMQAIFGDKTVALNSDADIPKLNPTDTIIDCIFGIGLKRPIEGWLKNLIQTLNNSGAPIYSVDMPSGLYASQPQEDANAIIMATETFTFQCLKLNFLLPETARYAGRVTVLDIGLVLDQALDSVPELLTVSKIKDLIKERATFSHKGTFGHTMIIGGSVGKLGAPLLAAKAALRSGSGLVSMYLPGKGYSIAQASIPEAMVQTDEHSDYITNIDIKHSKLTLGIGPGLGQHKATCKAIEHLLKEQVKPLVIDADALNLLAENPELLTHLPANSILTPHPKELERLLGSWDNDHQKLERSISFSKKYNCVLLIKGAHTAIVNQEEIYFNSTGNPGMATGGSGDVLTGIIAGLLAQGYSPLESAILGVYWHGAAADVAVETLGQASLIASDITNHLGPSFLRLKN